MQETDIGQLSDQQLLKRISQLSLRERKCMVEVIRHFIEVERRKLYLSQACATCFTYAKRIGFSEDEALKRARVARTAVVLPAVFEELEHGRNHLTGLFLLANYLTANNATELLAAARGKTRKEITRLIAERFPKPDVPERIVEIMDPTPALPLTAQSSDPGAGAATCPEPGAAPSTEAAEPRRLPPPPAATCPEPGHRDRVEPLSGKSYVIQFTASSELVENIDQARELLSHAIPGGGLSAIFGRALRELVQRTKKRLVGSDKPRKQRALKPGSRHIPVAVQRAVRERDRDQCAFVDERGVRCEERRFLTVEHRDPFAREGETTVENCCLHCAAHNLLRAKQVYGDAFIAKKIARRKLDLSPKHRKIEGALVKMGFKPREAKTAVYALSELAAPEADLPTLLRAALQFLGR